MACKDRILTEGIPLRTRDGRTVLTRPAAKPDAAPLARFYAEMDELTDRLYFVLAEYTVWVARDLLRRQGHHRELHLVLEAEDGAIAGHLSLQPFPGDCPRLGVCIAPEWRGAGIGRSWMQLALDLIEGQPGRRGAWLSVLGENAPARALYESLGFAPVREHYVRRDWSPFPANVGTFLMIDMLLLFPQRTRGHDFLP